MPSSASGRSTSEEKKFQNKLLSKIVNNSLDHKINENELLYTFVHNISQLPDNRSRELLTKLETIFKYKGTWTVLRYLLTFRASTVRVIESAFPELHYRTIRRALKRLERIGLVKAHIKGTPRRRKGGPDPRIYAVLEYEPEDIAKARERDLMTSIPGGLDVERLTQLVLDDYLSLRIERGAPKEISAREVRTVLHEKLDYGHYNHEILRMVLWRLRYVHQVKVWM